MAWEGWPVECRSSLDGFLQLRSSLPKTEEKRWYDWKTQPRSLLLGIPQREEKTEIALGVQLDKGGT